MKKSGGVTFPLLTDYADIVAQHGNDLRHTAPAPTVTIITVCRNAAATIERSILSVRGQCFQDYEHIVIDALSTDGTQAIVERLLRDRDLLVSEPDKGISDAMNKGIALSRGRFIQFVHADDWLSRGQLQASVDALTNSESCFVFGDLVFFSNGNPDFIYRGDRYYSWSIDKLMPTINHPTVLARRDAFENVGLFSLQYRCAMDYDWFLRLHRSGGSGTYNPKILGCMNHDGVSNTAYRRTMQEVREIAVAYGRNPVRARFEFLYRINKTSLGRAIRTLSAPVYRRIRTQINPSYGFVDDETLVRARE